MARYYQNPIIQRSLEHGVTHASSVLTNSDELAKFLARFSHRIKVLPAIFDFSLIEGCARQSLGEIRIGFAGSPSRIDDLDLVGPVIFPILRLFPNVVFEFAGVMPRGVEPCERVRYFPHTTDYAAFVRFQAERNWIVALAPLLDNEANRCKTDNKYREYGACEITGIYSNTLPYKNSVRHGVTGLLVDESSEAWFLAIKEMLENEVECKEIGRRAYADVRGKYCVEHVCLVWLKHIDTLDQYIHAYPSIPLNLIDERFSFKIVRSKIESIRMQVQSTHNIGGVFLVIKKSIRLIIRMVRNSLRN